MGDTLHVFDVLESGGSDQRGQPYINRLAILRELVLTHGSTSIVPVYTACQAKCLCG